MPNTCPGAPLTPPFGPPPPLLLPFPLPHPVLSKQGAYQLLTSWSETFGVATVQGGQITISPSVKEAHQVMALFQLPSLTNQYRSKAEDYLSHLVGHEGQGSLLSALKARGWASELGAGVGDSGYDRNTATFVFEVHITLTEAGLAAEQGILSHPCTRFASPPQTMYALWTAVPYGRALHRLAVCSIITKPCKWVHQKAACQIRLVCRLHHHSFLGLRHSDEQQLIAATPCRIVRCTSAVTGREAWACLTDSIALHQISSLMLCCCLHHIMC